MRISDSQTLAEPLIGSVPDSPANRAPTDAGADDPRTTELITRKSLITRLRFWILVASHAVTDLYPTVIFSLMVALEARLTLSAWQTATVIALNPIISGLAQPFFSWIADRFNTRVFGPLGLATGAICIGLIGHAQTFQQLVTLQIIGIAGIGVYHPIASAVAGRLSHDRGKLMARNIRRARGQGLSIFFAAGMIGGVFGPRIATFINEAPWLGLERLDLLILPGVIAAIILWLAVRHVPHQSDAAPLAEGEPTRRSDLGLRYFTIGILFLANSCRFLVNIGLIYLFGRWAETIYVASADDAATLHGYIISASAIGMGVSTLLAGRYVHSGQERGAMIGMSLLAAPLIVLMPFAGVWGMALLGFLVAFGYFALVPSSLSLAHRLLPRATSATGSLLLGCGWAVSAAAPFLAEEILERFGLVAAFGTFAVLMAMAGVFSIFLPGDLIRATADD